MAGLANLTEPVTAALTLQQPWAYAITHHDKRIENRVWAPGYRIEWLLIHAGLTVDKGAAEFLRDFGITVPDGLDAGAIVAVSSLTGVCSASVRRPEAMCECGRWAAEGQHHWQLGDVQVLDTPVWCRGQRGLWQPDERTLATVMAALR
jgi:enoyl reductase-like protein